MQLIFAYKVGFGICLGMALMIFSSNLILILAAHCFHRKRLKTMLNCIIIHQLESLLQHRG